MSLAQQAPIIEATVVGQPSFKNVSKLLAGDCPEYLSIIRVVAGTANITNGRVLIRRRCNIPDGAYNVNLDGTLSPTEYHEWMKYPDVDLVKPPIEKMTPVCRIPQAALGPMIQACGEIFQRRGHVVVGQSALYCEQDRSIGFAFPFNLQAPIRLNPRYLSIVLVEMLQYADGVAVAREVPSGLKHTEELQTPLIVGLDWGSLSLLMPAKGYYPSME